MCIKVLNDLNIDVNGLVRSAVVLAVGLPVALSIGSLTNSTAELVRQNSDTKAERVAQDRRDELAGACIDWMVSKADSKLERNAANEIDEIMGGEVDAANVCKWALR